MLHVTFIQRYQIEYTATFLKFYTFLELNEHFSFPVKSILISVSQTAFTYKTATLSVHYELKIWLPMIKVENRWHIKS